MKLVLDIHGVIDTNPAMFVAMATILRRDSFENEVHIVTGESLSERLLAQLRSYNNGEEFWDRIVSIQDELILTTPILYYDQHGRPRFDEEEWDSFKGTYCKENKIDLAIDDTEAYAKYFETPFLLYKHKGA